MKKISTHKVSIPSNSHIKRFCKLSSLSPCPFVRFIWRSATLVSFPFCASQVFSRDIQCFLKACFVQATHKGIFVCMSAAYFRRLGFGYVTKLKSLKYLALCIPLCWVPLPPNHPPPMRSICPFIFVVLTRAQGDQVQQYEGV